MPGLESTTWGCLVREPSGSKFCAEWLSSRSESGSILIVRWRCWKALIGWGSAAAAAAVVLLAVSSTAAARTTDASVVRGLQRLVSAPGGPIGVIATLYRNGRTTVLRAGRADVTRPGAPRVGDHMRIASIAKAFSGAVALHLASQGRLGLDDTIGQELPGMPPAWSAVTVRQMLNHTSGLPDYTQSDGFREQATTDPRGYVSPMRIIDWVRRAGLDFTPGSRYEYSNTDNIVVGLIAQRVSGRSYGELLSKVVFQPAGLTQTTFPTLRISLPVPFLHGYQVEPGKPPHDVTTFLSPSGAWASGAIVSTPADLGKFIRADLSGRFFGRAQRRQQMRFVRGSSSPAGPGTNSAGLAIFRYQTRCGTVYGHTGNFPGYVQWAAATADGRRSVTTSLNIAAPTGALLARLRSVQASAVCALLGR
jgi:D-alanyl-D-alanine carboxypeptidase